MKKCIAMILTFAVFCSFLAGCSCQHVWKKATCNTPNTCEKCGQTKGSPIGHSWLAATCEAPKTCEKCGKTKGDPLEHSWLVATCDAPRTCEKCGETDGEPAEHLWMDGTCESAATCAFCDAEKGAPAGHKWREATLEDPKSCTVCGKKEGEPLKLEELYPEGKSRHNGTTFLMNEEEYVALFNEVFKSQSDLKIDTLSRNFQANDLRITYSFLVAPGQNLYLEIDDDTKNVTKILLELDDTASFTEEMMYMYLCNCVFAFCAANGNIGVSEFFNYVNDTAYENSMGIGVSADTLGGVAYRLESQYHSLTMEIWVDGNESETSYPGFDNSANLTEEETTVVGEWELFNVYDSVQGTPKEDNELTMRLYLNADKTGKIVSNTDVATFTWQFDESWGEEYGSDYYYANFECILDADSVFPGEESIDSIQFDVAMPDGIFLFLTVENWLYQFRKA